MIKSGLIELYKQLLVNDKTQFVLFEQINQTKQKIAIDSNVSAPYKLPRPHLSEDGDGAVFITSRFRSGSTVFWNVFRSQPECTAFYEPFNERRWFDPSERGNFVDNTHIGVSSYWEEYVGLEGLAALYKEEWINTRLHMDATSYAPEMKAYIDELIKSSKARPVLQFNRVDFRLPWLKYHYPKAKILHLYRHPRDQWCSFLTDKKRMNQYDIERSYEDAFYLDSWCKDLAKIFPFLAKEYTPHPYRRFYFLWKLSFLYGQKFSDLSVGYEELIGNPKKVIEFIFDEVGLVASDIDNAAEKLKGGSTGKWRLYAEEEWFTNHEVYCEQVLETYLKGVANGE